MSGEHSVSGLRVAVIGPGAIGCLAAHDLCRAGMNVTLVDHRPERAEFIARSGIRLDVPGGKSRFCKPRCTVRPEDAGTHDLALFTVKAFNTRESASFARPIVGPDTVVVTLQNGMGYEKYLSDMASPGYFVSGVTGMGATLLEAGHVRLAGTGSTVMGFEQPPDDKALASLQAFAMALGSAGWDVSLVDDPLPFRWRKLVANVAINALTAITCLTNGELLEYPSAVSIQHDAVREAFQVMKKAGLDVEDDFEGLLFNVTDICKRTSANISSMLQDRMRKGRTEIEYINGFVCVRGERLEVPTPVNGMLLRLVRVMQESGWRAPGDLEG